MRLTVLSTFYFSLSDWRDSATPRDLQPFIPHLSHPSLGYNTAEVATVLLPHSSATASLPTKCMGPPNLGDRIRSPDPFLMTTARRGLDS